MKVCRYCHKTYPEGDFGVANTIDGKIYRRHKCRLCYRNKKRELRARYRRWIVDLKKSKKCVECGIADYRVLDFHHRNQEDKDYSIALICKNGRGMDSIKKEVSKCIVICANCHRIMHCRLRNKL